MYPFIKNKNQYIIGSFMFYLERLVGYYITILCSVDIFIIVNDKRVFLKIFCKT